MDGYQFRERGHWPLANANAPIHQHPRRCLPASGRDLESIQNPSEMVGLMETEGFRHPQLLRDAQTNSDLDHGFQPHVGAKRSAESGTLDFGIVRLDRPRCE